MVCKNLGMKVDIEEIGQRWLMMIEVLEGGVVIPSKLFKVYKRNDRMSKCNQY